MGAAGVVPPSGPLRVLKGGAWGGITGGGPSDVRGARRLSWPAASHNASHGWRIVHPER